MPPNLSALCTGALTPRTRDRYLIAMSAIFWGLILFCWLLYPPENNHSIWSHTFSFFGSWDEQHSPRWWWVFSVAMVFWGVAMLPLIAYHWRRLSPVSVWAAGVGAGLFTVGALGTLLVGIFPDARGEVFANWQWNADLAADVAQRNAWRWTDAHEKAAILCFVGYGLGLFWYTGWWIANQLRGTKRLPFAVIWPLKLWLAVFALAAYNQVSWALRYEQMKANAKAAGTPIGSSWGESLNTIYAFPLWENIIVYTLFIVLVWFTRTLPTAPPTSPAAAPSR